MIGRGKLPRLHVPEDCQSNQGYRDNPEHDVFAAVFFFCHRGSTAHLKSQFKCRRNFLENITLLF
jgi:hypothetical protein